MARRLHKTLIDYLVIAISPALIITLVGSLVFFLLEVFYRGSFYGRLQYIFALFVIGAVLIGRISIEEGRERAALFALPLAIVTLLAINKFVEFQGGLEILSFLINCGLIGLVWWSADKLTWDCTLIDESEEDSGEGLLEAVGLDQPGKAALQEEIAPPVPEPEATTSLEVRPQGWWDRFVERRRRPHAPGVWVVYFSPAAVALFGVGQLFIPADNLPSRQYAFQLLCIYTASGLGLLLTTSFLGLRRYLRQRRQEMPIAMVNLWLLLGTILIVGVMFVTMLLPRPNPEYAVSELPFRIGSPDQKPSPYGTGRDAVEEKQPRSQGVQKDDRQSDSSRSDRTTDAPSKGQQKPSSGNQTSAKKDDGAARKPSGKPENRNEPGRQSSAADKNEPVHDKSAQAIPSQEKQKSGDIAPETRNAAQTPANADRSQGRDGDKPSDSSTRAINFQRWLRDSGGLPSVTFFKWLVYGALGLIAAFYLWSHRNELLAALANLAEWLRNFWHNLFGGTAERAGATADAASPLKKPPRRFADFTDPFTTGQAAAWPPEKLVRYTFEALEVWALEHDCPRQSEQTPHEFARQIAASVPPLADDAARLADLYSQAAYASGTLPATKIARLSQLWQNMSQHSWP